MNIRHDPEDRRFVIRLPEGLAELSYAPAGEGVLDLEHTYVPARARGRGVAGALVQAAVDYARETGQRVTASCWYAREWLRSHPENRDLLAS